MTSWLTTILILLPMAGGLADLAAAALEGVGRLARDARLARRGRLLDPRGRAASTSTTARSSSTQQHPWFGDLGVSYFVGQFGFSLWLVGLTVICGAVACAYAWWAGRERPRAYFGLLLFLTGSVVGVFSAQDLLLFYAFFEAMLIPLYVLIGVWGGPGGSARRSSSSSTRSPARC